MGRQPAADAKPGSVTAPRLVQAATHLRAMRASHGETDATRILVEGAAKVVSLVVEAWDALVQQLGYADAEDIQQPVRTWEPDTLMGCAVDAPDRRADQQPYTPLAQRTRLLGS